MASAAPRRHDAVLAEAARVRPVAGLLVDARIVRPAVDLRDRELQRVLGRQGPARAEEPALLARLRAHGGVLRRLRRRPRGGRRGDLLLAPRDLVEDRAAELRASHEERDGGDEPHAGGEAPPAEHLPLADEAPDAVGGRQEREEQPEVGLARARPGEDGPEERPVAPLPLPHAPVDEPEGERPVHEPDEPPQVPRREEREAVAHEPEGRAAAVARDVRKPPPAQVERDAERGEPRGEGELQLHPDVPAARDVHKVRGDDVLPRPDLA